MPLSPLQSKKYAIKLTSFLAIMFKVNSLNLGQAPEDGGFNVYPTL